MFNKMLCYDLMAIYLRMRWIALTSFILNIISALCIRILHYSDTPTIAEEIANVFGNIFMFLAAASIFVIVITLPLFIGERYYRSFFSDEGYLTFTLPLSRRELLGSKMLCAIIYSSALYVFLLIVSVIYLLIIPIDGQFSYLHSYIAELLKLDGFYDFLIKAESIILAIAITFLFYSLVFLCIGLYAQNKKSRPIWLFVLYFFIGYVIIQLIGLFVCIGLIYLIDGLDILLSHQSEIVQKTWTSLFLLQISVAVSMFGTTFYNKVLSGIENKLNLS